MTRKNAGVTSDAGREPLARRSVLLSAAVALLAGVLPTIGRPPPSSTRKCRDAVASLWSDARYARRIGRSYLAQAPEDADPDRLAAKLFEGDDMYSALPSAALRERIARRRMRDFEDGDTVIVDGWVLARTEARLCALTALT